MDQNFHDTNDDNSLKRRLLINQNKESSNGIHTREEIQNIIYEVSKGSKFFNNEKVKDDLSTEKMNALIQKAEIIKGKDLVVERSVVENKIKELKKNRNLDNFIDAFYASVHELENPELKDKPMAVGGERMLCTANYAARRYGVRSAMPGYIAKKLCPELILIPVNFPKYEAFASQIRQIFEVYDPNFQSMSLDEAYLNITGLINRITVKKNILFFNPDYSVKHNMSPVDVVNEIRNKIYLKTKLTASAGLAANRFLSKVCSDINKPNGLYVLPNNVEAIMEFVHKLNIRKVPGIGRVLEKTLNGLDITTCGDILKNNVLLYKLMSNTTFNFLLKRSLGLGDVEFSDAERKSIGVERSFEPIDNMELMILKLETMSSSLAEDLTEKNLKGLVLTLKLKSYEFKLTTRSKTLSNSIHTFEDIFSNSKQLLKAEFKERNFNLKVRLLGLQLSKLSSVSTLNENDGILKYLKRGRDPESEDYKCLDSTKREANKFICPVCQEIFTTELKISSHIEFCLHKSSSAVDAFPSKKNKCHRTNPMTKDNISQKSIFSFLETKNKKKIDKKTIFCPICNAISFDEENVAELNSHIDNCLRS
ncbi:hypothetical protein HK099_000037 [Clydaea vesicula]|uniref:DNA polymerase kappa n=1 Tax=Clydaea vesicula TaxID=447962 RepID=A0AAD5XZW7_9FUNG|nr:hypothetical protein HK099_000037 [Clydaea vesicula]